MGAQFSEAAAYIKQASTYVPTVGLILGSGLGILADEIENPIKIKYEDIPGFPVSTVEGHAGQLVIGTLKGTVVCAMQGRFHFYEGYDMKQVTFPVRVMKEIGIDTCIVTNAAAWSEYVIPSRRSHANHRSYQYDGDQSINWPK